MRRRRHGATQVLEAARLMGPPFTVATVAHLRATQGDAVADAFEVVRRQWHDAVDQEDAVAVLRAEREVSRVLGAFALAQGVALAEASPPSGTPHGDSLDAGVQPAQFSAKRAGVRAHARGEGAPA